jgi:hypothetical protein
MKATKLFKKNIVESSIVTESHTYLKEHNYPVDVEETYLVCSDSGHGYIVQEITTTRLPLEEADLEVDEITLYTCSCSAFRYHDGIQDLEETERLKCEPCKHCSHVIDGPAEKHKKAQRDNDQQTLE